MIRVLIADDHPLVRQGLRSVIDTADDMEVAGEAGDGRHAVRLSVEQQPDVIIMDLQLPELHGIDATAQINVQVPAAAVLVLTMFDDDATVFAAVQAGALGYLIKGADGADILAAIRAAAAGQPVFGAALAARLRSWFATPPTNGDLFPELTARERDILDLLAAGLSNAEIGQRLHLSPKTIANNISAILTKLHLTQRSQAIVRARDAGLGRPR
ncbi:response regulator transcription factor [Dactylosporangium salmoneum]|uniref:Response regulator transcription factor n=1 Tax=Dactylosporangium salmoneum TaxID=53361 RepID=A0ABN3GP26_9ACTN